MENKTKIQMETGLKIINLRGESGLSHKDFVEVLQVLIDTVPKD